MNAKEYLTQLAQAAELTAEESAALLKVADKEKFAKSLEEGVMMRSDYSRQSDALRAEREKVEARRKETEAYYGDLVTWKAAQDQLYGIQSGQQQQQFQQVQQQQTTGDFISKKDFESYKTQTESGYINLLKAGLKLANRHAIEFPGEQLDLDALEKTAVEKKVSLDQAYNEWAGPRRAEKSKLDLEAKLKAAKEEGAREFASTHKIPMVDAQREVHPFFDRGTSQTTAETKDGRLTPTGERNLRDGFVEEWSRAGAANSSGT